MIRRFGTWEKTECDECGQEFQVTRTMPKETDGQVVCGDCASYQEGYAFAEKRQAERIAELEANNARLREALAFIAEDTSEYSNDYRHPYAVAEEALQETPADSLAAVRREAMGKMREECMIACENAYPYTEISSIDIEGLI